MIKLFISYRSLDSAKVDKLVTRMASLKNADGTPRYQIWQDKTSIPATQDWWQAIVEGINKCDIFVFMISRESVQNINCRDELTYARRRNRPIIPFVLEGEYIYNATKGKNDVDYWQNMPSELTDNRFQFLFYEGAGFVDELNTAVERLIRLGLKDIPVDFPPDPRDKTSNDTSVIYDQACDYAHRLDFEAARKKFQRLIDWQDKLFGNIAHEWMLLLYEYEQLVKLDNLKHARFQIPALWTEYEKSFPKPFIEGIFDPKDFKSRFNATIVSIFPVEKNQPPTQQLREVLLQGENRQSQQISLEDDAVLRKIEIRKRLLFFRGECNKDWTPLFETLEVQGVQMEMCLVPRGSFQMGSDETSAEKPIHPQTLKSYWIGVHPVTNAQWRVAVEVSKGQVKVPEWADWYNDMAKTNHPVVGVTWYQCVEFLQWLGVDWRLPTEPEWEYAARGLDNLSYPFGNDFKADLVVYNENSNKSTAAVGGRPYGASWVGAQDMSGNVWEWMLSAYKAYPYKADDGREKTSSNAMRVLRGGSWYYSSDNARAAHRNFNFPELGVYNFGFRCVSKL